MRKYNDDFGIKVEHFRYQSGFNKLVPNRFVQKGKHIPKGGATVVTLIDLDGNSFVGYSYCSKNDAFVRKYGLKCALGRAMRLAEGKGSSMHHESAKNRFEKSVYKDVKKVEEEAAFDAHDGIEPQYPNNPVYMDVYNSTKESLNRND